MKTLNLLSAMAVAGAAVAPQALGAATLTTYFGIALVTEATTACVNAKWTVGRTFAVNLREAIDGTHPRQALRFSDSTFTIVATQRPDTSWSGPGGATYDADISGLDVNPAVKFTGKATLQIWTSSSVTNARYMPSGEWTNWAGVTGCTLKMRTTLIQR